VEVSSIHFRYASFRTRQFFVRNKCKATRFLGVRVADEITAFNLCKDLEQSAFTVHLYLLTLPNRDSSSSKSLVFTLWERFVTNTTFPWLRNSSSSRVSRWCLLFIVVSTVTLARRKGETIGAFDTYWHKENATLTYLVEGRLIWSGYGIPHCARQSRFSWGTSILSVADPIYELILGCFPSALSYLHSVNLIKQSASDEGRLSFGSRCRGVIGESWKYTMATVAKQKYVDVWPSRLQNSFGRHSWGTNNWRSTKSKAGSVVPELKGGREMMRGLT
jgi:hypothetical protein